MGIESTAFVTGLTAHLVAIAIRCASPEVFAVLRTDRDGSETCFILFFTSFLDAVELTVRTILSDAFSGRFIFGTRIRTGTQKA